MKKTTREQIVAETDQIFMKIGKKDMALKDGSFPLVGSKSASPRYNRTWKRMYKQVKKARTGKM